MGERFGAGKGFLTVNYSFVMANWLFAMANYTPKSLCADGGESVAIKATERKKRAWDFNDGMELIGTFSYLFFVKKVLKEVKLNIFVKKTS